MKKIAFLISDLGTGGQERQLYYLVTTLPSNFIPVVCVMHFEIDDMYFKKLKEKQVEIVKLKGVLKIDKLRCLRSYLKNFNPHYVHSFSFHLNFVAWLVSIGLKAKVLGGIRSQLASNQKYSGRFSFYSSHRLPRLRIANNFGYNEGLRYLPAWIDRFWTKTFIVHNGINLSDFKEEIVSSKDSSLKSASIFRLHPLKRMDLLIDLIDVLKRKGFNIKHYHAGCGSYIDYYQDLIDQKNLNEELILMGIFA